VYIPDCSQLAFLYLVVYQFTYCILSINMSITIHPFNLKDVPEIEKFERKNVCSSILFLLYLIRYLPKIAIKYIFTRLQILVN